MTRKNVIWLIFDSIRADRTSVGGHSRDTTPTLESIGSRPDGLATTCVSHAIWSEPSVASMMTGTYPAKHGLGSHNDTLPADIPTVAERLSGAGYQTTGVSLNPYFSPTNGTDRGFDRFDFVSGTGLAREAGISSLASFLWNIRTFSGGLTPEKQKHSPDFLLNEIVKNRLRSLGTSERPFFLTAHYYGAHHPYYPSPYFRSTFADDLSMSADRAAEIAFEASRDVYSKIAERPFDDEAVEEAVEAMYDAQVAQVDALVDLLLSEIDRLNLGDDTILVVTSDHGDLLGEMGLFSHKLALHDALTEVPIAILGSDALPGADVGVPQHADFMQTILSEVGVDTDGMSGQRIDEAPRNIAVTQRGDETYSKTMAEVRTHDPEFDPNHVLPGFVTALRSDDWKYVCNGYDATLYRLPTETEDVALANPDIIEWFAAYFRDWEDEHGMPVESNESAEFDDAVQSRLEDLGYITD